jgi:hypothetical protein
MLIDIEYNTKTGVLSIEGPPNPDGTYEVYERSMFAQGTETRKAFEMAEIVVGFLTETLFPEINDTLPSTADEHQQ